MRKNFMKKIAALVTTASMFASLGTTTFAVNYDGTGIKINVNGVSVTSTDVDGIYNVKVDYTVDDGITNNIGVTMLAYTGAGLNVDGAGYTSYNDAQMQIVGIDQQKQSGKTGSFEFKVTTNNDNGAIKVAYGTPSIVMVSGDNVTPAAAMFTINEDAWLADTAEYTGSGEFDVEWPYDDAAVKQAIADNISINDIKLSKTETTKETQFSNLGTVTAENIGLTKSGDKYSATFTFPSDAVVEGAALASTLTGVNIGEITVNKKAWTITSTSYGEDNKLIISSQASLAAVKTAVEEKLAEVGVTVKGAEAGMTKTIKTVTVGDFAVVGGAEYDGTCAADQKVTGNVTAVVAGDTEVVAADSAKLTFALEVTVKSATAAKWNIAKAEMIGEAIEFKDQDKTVTADTLLESVKTAVNGKTVKLSGDNAGEEEQISLAGATVAVKDASKFVYTVTIPAATATTSANIPAKGYAFDITVVVKYKSASVAYGDLNGDGIFNMADARIVLKMGLSASNPNHYNATDEEKIKADVNGDGIFNMADARLILKRGLSASNPNHIDKFPVEE